MIYVYTPYFWVVDFQTPGELLRASLSVAKSVKVGIPFSIFSQKPISFCYLYDWIEKLQDDWIAAKL